MRGGVVTGGYIIAYGLTMLGGAYALYRMYLNKHPKSSYDFSLKIDTAYFYNIPKFFKSELPILSLITYLCFLASCFLLMGFGIAIFSLISSDAPYTTGPSPAANHVATGKCVVTSGASAVNAASSQIYVMEVNPNGRACGIDDKQTQRQLATAAEFEHAPPYSQFSIVTKPAHGSVGSIGSQDGRILYRPVSGYRGMDFFEYRILPDEKLRTVVVSVE
ncbi:MAG: Ig-like domain-containing protein [Acetobacteraceae bacterium]|nr:Ig-like domain-containing protein [Acetobacteraceae bacterium]